jgi:hypothetical protein
MTYNGRKVITVVARKVQPYTQPMHIVYCVMAAGVFHEFYPVVSGVLAVILFVEWIGEKE